MGLEVTIKNGKGGDYKSEITKDGEDTVIASPWPPFKPQKVRPFRQYLTTDGTASGSNDMGVDGSSTNVDFYIPAVENYDRYITTINILVGYGGTAKPYLFADGAALANGCRLFYESIKGEVDIHDAIKTNQDMFRLSFQIIPTAWEVRHVNANNDYGYIMSMDMTKLGLPYGVKVDEGTDQKVILRVRDDATNADSFNMIAYGFERFK